MKVHCALLGIGWFLAIGSAQAGPPFVSDDPETPPPHGWEINFPVIVERTSSATDFDAPLLDLNYGLPNLQLKLEFPFKILEEDKSGTSIGPGDLLLGVKWRFFNDEQSQIQLGVYPQLLVPIGQRARALGQGGTAVVLPVVMQKSCEKWTLYGNVGVWWRSAAESRDYFYAGAVLEREIDDHLSLGVELFGNSPTERGGRSDIGFNLGGTWKLGEHLNLLLAGGRDIAGDVHATGYVGLQILTK